MRTEVVLCVLCVAAALARAQAPADRPAAADGLAAVFDSPDTAWTSEAYTFAAPRFVKNEFGRGYAFNCDFALADPKYPRCIWDAKLKQPVDLSRAASIVMKVRITDLDAVKFVCLYLKSNGKWHLSRYYDAFSAGMNTIVYQIPDYRMEGLANPGKPDTLNRVDAIRVNVFPKDGTKTRPTTVSVLGLHASDTRIDGYASLPLFEIPAADKGLARASRRDSAGRLLENRIIHDMGSKYLTDGADAVIDKLKRAGINGYILTAWHGRGAIYRNSDDTLEPRWARYFANGADPAADMIRKARAAGIYVYGQFCVAYRGSSLHPEFPRDGLPTEGGYLTPYDLQDPAFRDFMVKKIVDFVTAYDVDGINLDYLRAVAGVSFSPIARDLYEKRYAPATPAPRPVGGPVEEVFANDGTTWTTETYKFAAPRHVSDANGKGYAFTCDFGLSDPAYPRCLWDAKLAAPLDLTRIGAIAMDVRVTGAASVKSIACFLRSNGRWVLSRYVDSLAEGANAVVFDQTAFRLEGTATPCAPTAFSGVDAVRLNVFPKAPTSQPVTVTVTGVRVTQSRIDELKGDLSPEVEARLLEWQNDAVCDIVRRVSAGARAARPGLVITADSHLSAKPQRSREGNNPWVWIENKWVDAVFNMDYGWTPDFAKFDEAARSCGAPAKCVPLLSLYDMEGPKQFSRTAAQVARTTDYALRKYPDCGVCYFDYGMLSEEQIKALRDGPFKEDAVPFRPAR